jgi:UDPglucose 6-dehydrogenase
MRQAASIDVIRRLQDLGARVQATDPAAMEAARPLLTGVTMFADPYACVADADAVALITEWPELVNLDWSRVADLVKRQIVIDGRNALPGPALAELGFTYVSVGRARLRPVATLRRVLSAVAVA